MHYKISVAIATWNRFEMVCEAIEAACAQTYPPFEVVVYDDCSPDDSYRRLIQRYGNNPKVKIFEQTKNTGGPKNCNDAVSACTGDYIAWCSDDDRFVEDHLENAVNHFESDPSIALTFASFYNEYYKSNSAAIPIISHNLLSNNRNIQKHLMTENPSIIDANNIFDYYLNNFNWPFHPSTMVFKSEVWKVVGTFDTQYALIDSDWFVRVAMKYNIMRCQYYGVLNRRHDGNWSNNLGATNMQKELREILTLNLHQSKLNSKFKNTLRFKINRFINKKFLLIFISRSRGGFVTQARESFEELALSTTGLKLLPKPLQGLIFQISFRGLRFIQCYLFWNKNKYRNAGSEMPL